MEIAPHMIARLREEKKILLSTIKAVEDWAFGEGYFITPSLKARIEMVRKLSDNENDTRPLEKIPLELKPRKARKAMVLSPEESERRAERMRQISARRWDKEGAATDSGGEKP